jgi:AraC-like DNA-binding protein
MNLREYLNRYRIEKISRMRRQNPRLSLLEIAEMCGFESPNTFYRAYNKYAKNEN